MRYALINPQDGIDRMDSGIDPTVQTKPGWRWLPCPVVAPPAHNPLTEIVTGPTYVVGETEVDEVWNKRNKTAQEISDYNAAIRQSAVSYLAEVQQREIMVLRALMLVILDEFNAHATKINAILTAIDNGANLTAVKANIAAITDYPTRTANQIRTAIDGKLNAGDADN